MTTTPLLILLLVCGAASGAEWQSNVTTSRLNAIWSGFAVGTLNITQLDPATALAGKSLFAANGMVQLMPATPAVDVRGQRLFVPVAGTKNVSLAVFDLSMPGKASLQKLFYVPGVIFYAVQYDSVRNAVWILSAPLNPDGVQSNEDTFVTSVDLSRGLVQRVGVMPHGVMPAIGGLGGGPVVIDDKNREMIISATHRLSDGNWNYSLVKLNLDTHKYTTIPLTTNLWPCAMARDAQSGTVYALFYEQAFGNPLAFGTVDTVTGKLDVISQWHNADLVFVVGSLAAYDSASAQFYTLLSRGVGPPVAVVTVSAKSGQLEHAAYVPDWQQPSGLFVF